MVCLLGPDLNLDTDRRSLARPQNKRHSRASGFVLVPALVTQAPRGDGERTTGSDAAIQAPERQLVRRQVSGTGEDHRSRLLGN